MAIAWSTSPRLRIEAAERELDVSLLRFGRKPREHSVARSKRSFTR
jgi:hypothetical protein